MGQTYRSLAAMLVPFDVLENSDCNFSRRLMCLNFTVIIEIFYLCTPELKKGGGWVRQIQCNVLRTFYMLLLIPELIHLMLFVEGHN